MRGLVLALLAAALLCGAALALLIGFAVWAHHTFTVGVSAPGPVQLGGLAAILLVGGATFIWLINARRA